MPIDDRLPRYGVGEEIAHAVTHGIGLALSLVALVALIVQAAVWGDAWHVAGCSKGVEGVAWPL